MRLFHRRKKREGIEKMKNARLTHAEGELNTLKARATQAIVTLDARRERNHWRESIEDMIQGRM